VDDQKLARARGTAGSGARRPSDIPRSGWRAVAQRVQIELKEDHVSLLAAGVAFKALLALFPALIAAISVWGLVGDPDQIEAQIDELTEAMPESAAALIQDQIGGVATSGTGQLGTALVLSLAIALWSASGGVLGLIEGCNAAYDETDTRSFPIRRGLALALTLGAIVFLLVTFGLIAVLPVVLGAVGLGDAATLAIRIGQWPLLALLTIGALAVVYRVGPDRRNPGLRWVTWGAAIATAIWLLGSLGFTLYVESFGNYEETYGAIAGVIVLMLWLYLASFAVLLGAEVNAELERQTVADTTVDDERVLGDRQAAVADATPQEYDPDGT
jgi:membrane protein